MLEYQLLRNKKPPSFLEGSVFRVNKVYFMFNSGFSELSGLLKFSALQFGQHFFYFWAPERTEKCVIFWDYVLWWTACGGINVKITEQTVMRLNEENVTKTALHG